MAFKDFHKQQQGIELLQRSLQRGRLAHAYIFTGSQLDVLQRLALTLAKTLNCLAPVRRNAVAIDCCDHCRPCVKIEHENRPDVHWVRPESKSRVITIDQVREVVRETQLKSNESTYKIAVIVAADRLRVETANALLKTLEEPPANSILVLLSTDPGRILETIVSRCLRLNFAGEELHSVDATQIDWLATFSQMAGQDQKSLLGRYRLLDSLLQQLNTIKAQIEEALTARSPLQRYKDVEKGLTDKWEAELVAGIEAEYRGQRLKLLALLEWWLREVWLQTLRLGGQKRQIRDNSQPAETKTQQTQLEPSQQQAGAGGLLSFPQMAGVGRVAERISPKQAKENLEVIQQLQSRLNTNVQEALALEVGLLKLNL